MMKCEIKDTFYVNGAPFQIISGAIHYFRVVPEYWRDRLEKLKALGCNTVETYIPWNLHEPRRGEFCFEGIADVERFARLAQELELYVILRPSPYICAEWEWGGLPSWLLAEDGMRPRTSDPRFMEHVAAYYKTLLPRLAPLQIHRGGPVILMQLENEYGSYGNDKDYLRQLRQLMLDGGIEVPLITSDGPDFDMLHGGTIEGVRPTCNFGSKAERQFGALRAFAGEGPLMCTEFWIGWFDHWGYGVHMPGELEVSAKYLDKLLELGNVNFYMFHGGTNFGFMNGSNYYEKLMPDVTSYDYDAILTEDGQITEKYRRYQEIIRKYRNIPEVQLTGSIRRRDYGTLPVRGKVGLFSSLDALSAPVESVRPQSMERLGQDYGYILYRTDLRTEEHIGRLRLLKANDRAQVFVDGKPAAALLDRELLEEVTLDISFETGARLDILVENMGRVNFGCRLEEQRKGIDQGVVINGHMHDYWTQYPLPLNDLSRLDFSGAWQAGLPGFYRFTLEVDEPADTFLDFQG
ncbi:MAG: beta-galactosidase, partial [Oscillospiraceae bacterium]|nr:beta-galactosidase [Oscillospiraceae bacterium]